MVNVLDISDYFGDVTPAIITAMKANGVMAVIVRGSLEDEALTQIALQQITALQAAGFIVYIYMWAYSDDDPRAVADLTVQTFPTASWYFIDIEDTISWSGVSQSTAITWLQNCLDEFFTVLNKNVGLYSALWCWSTIIGTNITVFDKSPLWYALYDGSTSIGDPGFGGFTWVVGHQFDDNDVTYGNSVDDNYFDPAFLSPPVVVTPTGPNLPTETDIQSAINDINAAQKLLTNAVQDITVPQPSEKRESWIEQKLT